jgi:hypothetical protein
VTLSGVEHEPDYVSDIMIYIPIVLISLAVATAGAHSLAETWTPDVMSRAKSNCLIAVAKTVNRPRSPLKIIKVRRDASGV